MFNVLCGGQRYSLVVRSHPKVDWGGIEGGVIPASLYHVIAVGADRVLRLIELMGGLRELRALGDIELRTSVAVAWELGEMALRAELLVGPPWERDVVLDVGLVASRIGATRAEVRRAVAALLSSQVILYSPGVGSAVRVAAECWIPAPRARAIPWDIIRERLAVHRLPRMPAVAFLRELAVSTTSEDGWIHLTLEDTAARTFFKRSALARAASDLERIGSIDRSHRPGQRGLYRIRRVEESVDVIRESDLVAKTERVTSEVSPRPAAIADASSARSANSPADVLPPPSSMPGRTAVIEIAGVAFPIPAGTTITPEIDDVGRLWYRLGTGATRIGPIT